MDYNITARTATSYSHKHQTERRGRSGRSSQGSYDDFTQSQTRARVHPERAIVRLHVRLGMQAEASTNDLLLITCWSVAAAQEPPITGINCGP